MRRLLLTCLSNIIAFYATANLIPEVRVDRFETGIYAGLVLGLINLLLRPLMLLIALPVNLLTLGLFTLVIDTCLVMWVGSIFPGLVIPGFWGALLIALIISGINLLFDSAKNRR